MYPDFEKADDILRNAVGAGRYFLYEYEVYDFLSELGIGDVLPYKLIKPDEDPVVALKDFPPARVILKIVHPHIIHKNDVGGVGYVLNPDSLDPTREYYNYQQHTYIENYKGVLIAPKRQAVMLIERGEIPHEYQDLSKEEFIKKFVLDTAGVLAVHHLHGEEGFEHLLFLGMRDTREFGPVITAGSGGSDVEKLSDYLVKDHADVTVSPGVTDEKSFFNVFRNTLIFKSLAGDYKRNLQKIDEKSIEDLLARFHACVWRYSSLNPDAPFWFSEFEINPFKVNSNRLWALDGVLKFRDIEPSKSRPPLWKLRNLLKPENIAVIGVSGKEINLGRVILRNLIDCNFPLDKIAIVKPGDEEIDGVRCYPSIGDLPGKFDLIILSVAAQQVPSKVSEIIDSGKAESIILITGGMGEKDGAGDEEEKLRQVIEVSRKRDDSGPVLVGGNSLGLISVPGGYDTMFVSKSKLPRDPENPMNGNIAFISQSGAFMVSRMSNLSDLRPRYVISTGNQVDLGVADFVGHLSGDPDVRVFGIYMEGLRYMEGLHLAEIAKKITRSGRDVIIYKAGRSKEGRHASSGHTAAIAGDWDVANAVLTKAGCIVTQSFEEWQNLVMLLSLLSDRKIGKGRLAAVSNAGYEAVGMADSIKGSNWSLELANYSDATIEELTKLFGEYNLTNLVNLRNPMDLTPMATDFMHAEILNVIADDENVDVLIYGCVPLSHIMKTLGKGGADGDGIEDPESICQLVIDLYKNKIQKPFVMVVDSGTLYDPMAKMLLYAGIPVFRSADDAVRTVGRWVSAKVYTV
jgi:acyl-CoA synthetase (NDP forming)